MNILTAYEAQHTGGKCTLEVLKRYPKNCKIKHRKPNRRRTNEIEKILAVHWMRLLRYRTERKKIGNFSKPPRSMQRNTSN